MHAKIKSQTLLVMACIFILLIGFSFVDFAHADSESKIPIVCVNDDYDVINLEVTSKTTGLKVKEELAHKLNDGISPEDIVLLYKSWANIKEHFANEAKIKDYKVKKLYYVISPLSMGSTYKNGDTIDFPEDGARVQARYKDGDSSYFYGENAVCCQGQRTIKGKEYVKIIIGSTPVYLKLKKEGKDPTGFTIAHVSYDPYSETFIYGLRAHNGL